jgi:hypothetical protein
MSNVVQPGGCGLFIKNGTHAGYDQLTPDRAEKRDIVAFEA